MQEKLIADVVLKNVRRIEGDIKLQEQAIKKLNIEIKSLKQSMREKRERIENLNSEVKNLKRKQSYAQTTYDIVKDYEDRNGKAPGRIESGKMYWYMEAIDDLGKGIGYKAIIVRR